MIPTGGLQGTWNAVTSKQFWFVVIFSSIAALIFFGFLHYAEEEMTRKPTEQEKEEFWQRQAERRAENHSVSQSP